jgi:hypothetical protein
MRKFLTADKLLLAILLVLGLLLRLDFLLPVNFVIDSDEAIVGLMAKHITEGQPIPTFYYGQHYMGSLEPLLVSGLFEMFGISNILLKTVPLIFSLALIVIIYYLTLEIAGRYAAFTAALLTSLAPNSLVVWSGKARGGFIEILVIGALAMLCALKWLKKEKPDTGLTVLVALLLGLGWWVNNQIIYFMLPIGFLFLLKMGLSKEALKQFLWGLFGFFLGGLPYWIYNINNKFISFEIFGGSESKELWKHISGLFATSLPIIMGSKRFWTFEDIFPYSTLLYYSTYLILLLWIIKSRKKEIFGLFKLRAPINAGVEMMLLFIIAACCVFALSSYGYLVHAPRYLLPLYVVIMPLTGYAVELIAKKSAIISFSVLILLLSLNIFSNYSYERSIPGEPYVYKEQRVAKDHTELISWLEKNNVHWIRTNYWIGYRLAFETNEKIKFDLFQEPVQLRIPSYREEAFDNNIEEMPMVLVPGQAILVQKAMRKLKYTFQSDLINGYKVIYNIKLPRFDFKPVDNKLISVETNFRPEIAKLAVDDNKDTRWGTAHPQTPDMKFTLKISRPVHLKGIKYNLGTWAHDWPRALKIEAENSKGEVKEVFDDSSYSAIRYFTQDNACFSMFFDAPDTVKVILSQVGKDPVFDWSIAEMELLEPPGEKAD